MSPLFFAWNLAATPIPGESDQEPIVPQTWEHRLTGMFALTQAVLKDWELGASGGLLWRLAFDGESVYQKSMTHWSNTYKPTLGYAKFSPSGFRKTDDQFDFETVLTRRQGFVIDPNLAATLKTQFASGFEYDPDGSARRVSGFLDPAYFRVSMGGGYKPIPEINTRIGIGSRLIFTQKFPRYADNPETVVIEKIQVTGGLESVIDVNWESADRIHLTSKLELFSPFDAPTRVVVRNDTRLTLEVNKYVQIYFETLIFRDTTITADLQLKQTLMVGVSYTFF